MHHKLLIAHQKSILFHIKQAQNHARLAGVNYESGTSRAAKTAEFLEAAIADLEIALRTVKEIGTKPNIDPIDFSKADIAVKMAELKGEVKHESA